MNSALYANYLNILKQELVPALGCTEPIAIAYTDGKSTSDSWRISRFCRNGTQWKYYQEC